MRQPSPHALNGDFKWTDVPQDRALRFLDRDQVNTFDRLGYLHIPAAFSDSELDEVEQAIDPIEAELERLVAEVAGGKSRLTDAGTITFTTHIVTRSDTAREFARNAKIHAICQDLMGAPARLYWDQSVYKKTGKKQEFPWHQDNGYTFIEPQQYLTFWIPLVDVDESNGCPWIVPGLHRNGTLAHWETPIGLKCLEESDAAVCVPAKRGDIILFSSLAPHRTGPNLRDGTIRKAYILQYAPDGAHTVVDGTRIPQNDPERQFLID
ncbi:phytanoyl-CoA dioxygenase family protein [Sphingopyxis lindanitolerans]|nr:phytanoyl-CoA dioxygenase family protein [Sphingopyxis lindanitolerans]